MAACGVRDEELVLLLLDLKSRLKEVSRLRYEKWADAAAWSRDGELLAVMTRDTVIAAAGKGWVEIWRIPETMLVPWLISRDLANRILSGVACMSFGIFVRLLWIYSRSRRKEEDREPATPRYR